MSKKYLLVVLLFFSASLACADEAKVFKVFIIKVKKNGSDPEGVGSKKNEKNVLVEIPTDQELEQARLAVQEAGLGPDDLKDVHEERILESYVLKVEKTNDPPEENSTVNGIRVEKPTDAQLEVARKEAKVTEDRIKDFAKYEFQMGLGGTFPLSEGLNRSYQPGFNFDFGFGYKFSNSFSLLLVVEGTKFSSNNDALTGKFDFNDTAMELLAKFRFASNGFRPYFFAGPGIGLGDYRGGFTFNGLDGEVNYRDQGHFIGLAGAGFEIQLYKWIYFFAQGELAYDFIDDNTANFASLDKPIRFTPVSLGIVFSR